MTSFECDTAFDCSNSTIARECYEQNNFRDEIFFCDCSNWFGWVGENCDEPKSTIYYLRTVVVFMALWHLFNFSAYFKVAYVYLKVNYPNKPKGVSINLILYVAILECLSAVCYIGYEITQATTFYDPSLYQAALGNSLLFESRGVQRTNSVENDGLALFGGIFHGLAAMLIVISWLDVFDNMNKIFSYKGFLTEKKIKNGVLSLMVILLSVFITLFALKAVVEVYFIYIIASGLLGFCFLYGYIRLRRRINDLLRGQMTRSAKRMLHTVKRSAQVNAFCFSIVLGLSAIYYYGVIFHLEILKIGSVNYFFIVVDVTFICVLLSSTYNSYYGHRINSSLRNRKVTSSQEATMNWNPVISCFQNIFTLCKKKRKNSFSTKVIEPIEVSQHQSITLDDL